MTIDGTRARESFATGANCAEAVLAVFDCNDAPAAAAGFTQGLGGSGCVCGALAAGAMAISAAVAEEGLEPAASRARAEALTAALHDRFRERWGSTCCRVLKRGQIEASDAWTAHCAEIVESAAEMTRDVLAARTPARAWAARDVSDVVRRAAADGLTVSAAGALVAVATGANAASFVLAAAVGGILAGALLESRGTKARRAGRVMRAIGIACVALLGAAAAVAPVAVGHGITSLLDRSATAVAAASVLAVLGLLVALFRIYDLKRYR